VEGSPVHCNLQQSTQTALLVYTMNIVFTLLCGIFYNGNHPLGFPKLREFLD